MAYRLTATAAEQIDTLLLDSARKHGTEAADRYSQLILVVMAALGQESTMIGSIDVPRLAGVRAYATRLARQRVQPSRRVANPRHLIVYRVSVDGVVEILGLVHDRMVLSRAARRLVPTEHPPTRPHPI